MKRERLAGRHRVRRGVSGALVAAFVIGLTVLTPDSATATTSSGATAEASTQGDWFTPGPMDQWNCKDGGSARPWRVCAMKKPARWDATYWGTWYGGGYAAIYGSGNWQGAVKNTTYICTRRSWSSCDPYLTRSWNYFRPRDRYGEDFAWSILVEDTTPRIPGMCYVSKTTFNWRRYDTSAFKTIATVNSDWSCY